MAILKQSPNGYVSYLGKYGKCDETDCEKDQYDLTLDSKIFNVLSIDEFGTNSYIRGNPWFLQRIKKLECGGIYWITLMPGDGQVDLDHFVSTDEDETKKYLLSLCGDETNYESSTLRQIESEYKSYFGWYGICDTDLKTDVKISSFENIFSVIQTKSDGGILSYTKGNPEFLQNLKTFESGNPYWITLLPGTDSVNIDGFSIVQTTNSNEDKIPLLTNCDLNLDNEATPTPISTQTEKFPVMLVGWEWDARRDAFGRERWSAGSNKFGDENYLFDNYDYRKLKTSDILDMLNASEYKHPLVESDEPTGSVKDYFKAISFGQFDMEFEILPANEQDVIDVDDPDQFAVIYDSPDVSCSYDTKRRKTQYAYELDNLINVGFANIVNNFKKQGRDYEKEYGGKPLTILHAGFSTTNLYGSSYFIRSHVSNVNVDNLRENLTFSITNLKRLTQNQQAATLEPIGVPVHETIHTWGVIDLYETSSRPSGTGVHKIAVMSYGSSGSGTNSTKHLPTWPLSWTRYELSLQNLFKVNVVNITKTTKDIEIKPACEENKLYRIQHPTESDCWWVDFRTPNSKTYTNVNFDKYLPESGLCIVHQGTSGGPRKNLWAYPLNRRGESGYYIAIEQADGSFELQSRFKFNVNNDLYKPNHEFSPHTTPSSVSRSGVPSGIKLHNIRETENNTIIFDVDFITEPSYKIKSINYNFYEETSSGGKTIIFDKSKFKEKVLIAITTENIEDGTQIDLKINPSYSTRIITSSGEVQTNVCVIEIDNGYLVNMTKSKNVNYFHYSVNQKNKILSETFPWTDYVVIK